jgi:iron-sulfur cluster assembly accessory protein
MIHLTERAAAAVAALQQERAEPGQVLRIYVEAGGCSGFEYAMGFGVPQPGDQCFAQHGVTIAVDSPSLERIDGSEVDFDDGLTGKGFEIRNPLAKSTCGCGKSFN